MSDHSLPEDLSAWPSNPYVLLGVQYGVGPNELRRAYTRLIRTYKPEQYPDHFRRIREAYESVLGQLEFMKLIRRETSDDDDSASPSGPTSAPASAAATEEEPADPAVIVPRPWQPTADDVDELEKLWKQACGGEEAAVYRRLVEMHESQPGRTDVLLRLYWLLALTPELAPARSPCSWLVAGLRGGRLTGPLWELYRREIQENPEEAITERCTDLLQQAAGSGQLTDLVELRWQAAARLGNWQIIDDDMETLHERLANSDPDAWIRLVISAAEKFAFQEGTEPQNLIKNCQAEINRYPELHTRMADEIDRLELHLDAAAALHKLEKGPRSFQPPGLIRLVRLSLSRPHVELRPALMDYLAPLARDPRAALDDLDLVARGASPVLAQFSNILVQFRGYVVPYGEDGRSRESLALLVQAFLEEVEYTSYPDLRPKLVEFCNREAIFPEAVAELADNDHLANQIMGDWPLRCVCLGCYLFWR